MLGVNDRLPLRERASATKEARYRRDHVVDALGIKLGPLVGIKLETVRSGEAKNHPTQSSPTPHATIARPHRDVDQVNGTPPRPPLPSALQLRIGAKGNSHSFLNRLRRLPR
jgi:hypothetical protein